MANYFTSDYHLGHTNIRKLLRPEYQTTAEMDDHIIEVTNSVAHKGDILYYLGDWAWRNYEAYAKRIRATVVFVRGNHDPSFAKCRGMFTEVRDIVFKRRIDGKTVTMCHYPMDSWPGDYMLHGHRHHVERGGPAGRFNVCWDIWHRPVTLAEAARG